MGIHLSYLKSNPFVQRDSFFREFQQNLLRWTVFVGGLPIIAWQLFEQNRWALFICVAMIALVIWLQNRSLALAGVVLYAGFSALILGLAANYQEPAIRLYLCVLPLLMTVCFGAAGGIPALAALAASGWLAERVLPGAGLAQMFGTVTGGGALLVLIGLFVRYWMVALVGLYYENYYRVSDEVQELRVQRVEFKQVQEDLVHANNELARLTRQLKLLNQIAEEARMAKENFVAMVSHELRTPLNMIIGFSEVITRSPRVYGSKLPPSLLADISSIQHNSQHLLELVNDVLDLSQVDVGNLAISREWCAIQEIIDEAFEVIRPLFQSKGLFLEAQMPARDPEQKIYCDKTRVREIVINLLSNAGRFTETGGVIVRAFFEGNQLVVAVQDTGPGISPENQAKLFEPFQQLDSTIRRRYGGSGLGLAISKRFVELHGGRMWLESQVGQGTTFFFSLPVSAAEGQVLSTGAERWVNRFAAREGRARPFKGRVDLPRPRCILLEEGQTLQHLLTRYLDDIEILPIQTADQAAEVVSQFPSQLLIINHPQAEVLMRSITSQGLLPVGLPVLAFWMPGGKDFSDAIGANRYLVKPVSNEALLEAAAGFGAGVKRILLVDDNPEIIQLFGRVLTSSGRGYQVLRASHGEQALELLRARKPDLMILDLIMPELNGFQVLEAKAIDPKIRDIPVVVITAQDPAGLPKVSQSITIAREGGFSSRDLIELIETLGLSAATHQQSKSSTG